MPLTTFAKERAESVEARSSWLSSRTTALTARLDSAVVEEAMIVATLRSSCHLGQVGVLAGWLPPQLLQWAALEQLSPSWWDLPQWRQLSGWSHVAATCTYQPHCGHCRGRGLPGRVRSCILYRVTYSGGTGLPKRIVTVFPAREADSTVALEPITIYSSSLVGPPSTPWR